MKMTRLHHLSVTAVTNNHRLDGLKQHKLLIYYAVGQRSTGVSPVKTKVCTPGSCRGESFSLPHLASSSHSHSQARASFLQHQNQQCWADSLSLCHQTGTTAWKDSLTAMAPHSSTLAWKIPWTEEPWWAAVRGVTKSQAPLSDFTFTFHFHTLEKEMATHSSILSWRIPGTEEPSGLPSMGSHRVGHD